MQMRDIRISYPLIPSTIHCNSLSGFSVNSSGLLAKRLWHPCASEPRGRAAWHTLSRDFAYQALPFFSVHATLKNWVGPGEAPAYTVVLIRFRLGTGRMPQVKGQALHVRMRNRGDNTWFTCVRWCTRTDSAADCTAVSYYGVWSHSQAIYLLGDHVYTWLDTTTTS